MVSSRDASAPPQKKCMKKGMPHYFNATAPFLDGRRGNCVKILLPGTEPQGFAGSGERGANRALKKPAGPVRRRGICVKNLLPGTELQGLAERGEQTAPRNTRPPGL